MIFKLNLIAKLFGVTLLVLVSASVISSQCTGGQVASSCNATGDYGPNMIINPSFEAGGVTGWLYSGCGQPNQGDPFLAPCGFIIRDGWSTFNAGAIRDASDPFTPCNPQTSAPVAYTGKNYLKMWDTGGTFLANEIVNNGGPTNWPAVDPGTTYCASVRMLSPAARLEGCNEDHITGNQGAVIRIEYWLADNTLCHYVESPKFDEGYANGGWYTFTVQGIAPPGAVRANVIMVMTGGGGGAVYFDDVSFAEKLDDGPAFTSIACNDHVNVSVNGDCSIDLTANSLVEGSDANNFNIVVTDYRGNVINLDDVSEHVGSHNATFTYEVSDPCSGTACWGTITLEDKTDPILNCADCTDPLVSNPGCVFNCTEEKLFSTWIPEENRYGFDDGLLDALIPSDVDDFIDDFVSDNCGAPVTAGYRDSFSAIGNCSEGTLMTRTWTVNFDRLDGSVGTAQCVKYYRFDPINVFDDAGEFIAAEAPYTEQFGICVPTIDETIEDQILMPKQLVEIPTCNVAIDPASLQAYFDNITSEDDDTDDDGNDPDEGDVDCVVEANEGTWIAYPHYYIEGLNERHNYSGIVLSNVAHAQVVTEVCNVIVDYTDTPLEACAPGCGGNTKTLRTWTVLDWCSSTFAEYQQIIKVVDDFGPRIQVESFEVSVDPWICGADVHVPAPSLSDNCDTDLTYSIGFVEGALQVSGNAADGYIIHNVPIGTTEYQYVAEDCCGNRSTSRTRVTVVDNTPPVPVTKQNLVVELVRIGSNDIGGEQGTAKIHTADINNGSYDSCTDVVMEIRRSDVCHEEDDEWGDFVSFCCADLNGAASASIDVEIRVCDKNGNCNQLWSTVLLEDKAQGAVVCPPDMILRCTDDIWDLDLTGLPFAFNTCGDVDLGIDSTFRAELIEDTEYRKKNRNQGSFPFTIYDGVEVPEYNPHCGFGAVRRRSETCGDQWFIIEPYNTTVTYDEDNEIFVFDSKFDPSSINWPADQTVDCDGYETGEPTWVDPVCQSIGADVVTEVLNFEADACLKILNHWTVIDFCKYDPSEPDAHVYRHTQVIKVIDTEAPTVTSQDSLCFAVNTDDCTRKGVTLSAVGSDTGDCSSAWIGWDVNVDYNNDWVVDCVFSTNVSPVLANGEPNPKYLAKTASGETVTIALDDDMDKNTTHRIEWVVNDGCGNRGSYTTTFTVEDKKAPTPYCLNLGTAVMSNGEVELWAIDFNQGSFDNCSPDEALLYTFTDVPPPPRCDDEYDSQTDLQWYDGSYWFYDSSEGTFDPDDRDCPLFGEGAYEDGGWDGAGFPDYIGDIHRWFPGFRSSGAKFTREDVDATGYLQLPVYVWDECGQIDFCLVQLRIIDNNGGAGLVSGDVRTETGEEVEDVQTQLMSNTPGYPKYDMTNDIGEYAFDDNALTQDYEVTGKKNDDYLNGVSTIDLVKLQRHILGLELLDSPYKLIAADINNDRRINGQDLVELRKLILGIYTELPQNSSWRIMKSDQEMDAKNPWIFDETITIAEMGEDMMDADFIGVKVGDLDNSVIANATQNTVSSSRGTSLEFNDVAVEAGSEIEVTMTTQEAMYGYQFTLDMTKMELVSVEGQGVTEGNVGVFDEVLTMSKASTGEMTGELFTLTLKAKQSGQVSELLGMNSSVTTAEAYVGKDLEVVDLSLAGQKANAFSLGQNEPNPFKEMTRIAYTLPEASAVTMTLYDVTGKVLQVIRDQGAQGSNVVEVSNDKLTTGVVYYKLETGEYTATKHMIVIE